MEYLAHMIKKGLVHLASKTLLRYKPTVIALVGGVGKSTTKEVLFKVLSKRNSVRKTEKSLTTPIGVPFTILGAMYDVSSWYLWLANFVVILKNYFFSRTYPEYVILEIDAHNAEEIQSIIGWLSVDILVYTPCGEIPSHVEAFLTPAQFVQAHRMLLRTLTLSGTIVYVAHDTVVDDILKEYTGAKISYGQLETADICGGPITYLYEGGVVSGMQFTVQRPLAKEAIVIQGTVGLHIYNAICATMGVMQALNEHPFEHLKVFQSLNTLPGRMKLITGIKGSIIVDDSYNSSYVGLEEALVCMHAIDMPRKILVLGDMLELGRFSVSAHKAIAHEAVFADILVCVGVRARLLGEEVIAQGKSPESVLFAPDGESAGRLVQNLLQEKDLVLVKGSQDMRLERAVEEIMQNPEKKERLLVRQEKKWVLGE